MLILEATSGNLPGRLLGKPHFMALARIFARDALASAEISRHLEQLGYTVEIASPEDAPATPAELEIQLESCEPGSVLGRAEELASRYKADIAVAPGALPSHPSVEAAGSLAAQAAKAQLTQPLVGSETLTGPGDDPQAESANTLPIRLRRSRHTPGVAGGVYATAKELLSFAHEGLAESLEHARIAVTDAGRRRQARLLDLARQQAENRLQALAAESARRALAVHLLQWEREHPSALVAEQSVPPRSAASPQPGLRLQGLRLPFPISGLQALVGAGSLAALVVIGLAITWSHSRPAPSTKLTPPVPSAITPKPEIKPTSPQPPSSIVVSTQTKPSPQVSEVRPHNSLAPNPNRDLVTKDASNDDEDDVVIRHFTTTKPKPLARPTPAPAAAQVSKNGWKHFSDMEQTGGWKHFSDLSH